MIHTTQLQIGTCRVDILNVGDSQISLAQVMDVPEAVWRAQYAEVFEKPTRSPIQCILIRHPETTVLVDAGAPMPPDSPYAIPGEPNPPDLVAQLEALRVDAQDVAHVAFTHAHFDHINGALDPHTGKPRFVNAQHYLGLADWQDPRIQAHLKETFGDHNPLGVLEQHGLLSLIEGKHALHADLTLYPTPGESPGHQSLRVSSHNHVLYCVGDLYHHPIEVEHPDWATSWADKDACLASRKRLEGMVLEEDAVVVATHIRGAGRLTATADEVSWVSV